MYGMRDAVQNWEVESTDMMKGAKFKQGSHSACMFYDKEHNIRAAVHGDGFPALGRSEDLDWHRSVIEKKRM